MFSAKTWFVKISTRIMKSESRLLKSNPEFIIKFWKFVYYNQMGNQPVLKIYAFSHPSHLSRSD